MSLQDYELYEDLKLYKELQESNGILFYKPHRKQDLFHRAGAKKRRFVRTGNRFGKSTMGAAEDVAWALGYRPWYPEGDPARYAGIPQKSNKILIIVQDWDKANEIFTNPNPGEGQGKLFKFIPKDAIVGQPSKSKAGVINAIKIKSKWGGVSIIYLDTVMSYQANPMGQESSDWDAIHVDEPCPQAMWNANARGLVDRNGSAWFTCTPLSQGWINDMFRPKDKRVDMRREVNLHLETELTWMITGEMQDNPILTKEAIALFADGLTEAEKDCRLKGLPLSMSGLVYKQFDYSSHVYTDIPHGWRDHWTPPKDYTIRVAVDPHPDVPHAVLCAATAPTGEVFFFHEIFESLLAPSLAEKINDSLFDYEVFNYLMDPSGYIESPTDGSSMATEFDKFGIYCNKAVRDLKRGILVAQAELGKMIHTPSGYKTTKLKFGVHMTRTLWEFDNYEWNPKKEDSPIDGEDHMMENFYRLCVHGLEYVPPEVTGGKPIKCEKLDLRGMSIPKFNNLSAIGRARHIRPSYRSNRLR